MKHVLAVIPTLFLIAFSAVAQSQTTAVSEEIVVTASALPERADDTPASVTVITREDIESRVARDVSDVLREVPGVTIARIGSAGHQTFAERAGRGLAREWRPDAQRRVRVAQG